MLRGFIKSIITGISLMTTGALLFAVMTAYISPVHTSVLAFVGYVFPFLWVVNAVLFVFWLLKKRWQALIVLTGLLITWSHWEHSFQWQATKREANALNQPLSVMSFNTRLLDYYQWIGEGTNEKIFDFIRRENPDVLCIQEFVTSNSNRGYSEHYVLRRLNQYRYKHIEYRSGKGRKRNYGLVTFSKYPIVEKHSFKFNNSNNFSIYSDIQVGDERIRVFNSHLESIKFSTEQLHFLDSLKHQSKQERNQRIKGMTAKVRKAFESRAEQAETIGRYITNSPYAPLVCGDFNDTPVSYVYRKMRGTLKDAFVESGNGFGGTYNGPLPSFRIDFIFHDERFDSYNFERKRVNLSDHYPIMTTLELKPTETN